jgi:hypothetical protein
MLREILPVEGEDTAMSDTDLVLFGSHDVIVATSQIVL